MPKDNDKKDNNAKNSSTNKSNSTTQTQEKASSSRTSTPSSTYHKCSDPSSKFSVHSAEANRQIAESRAGYISKFGGGKSNKR